MREAVGAVVLSRSIVQCPWQKAERNARNK